MTQEPIEPKPDEEKPPEKPPEKAPDEGVGLHPIMKAMLPVHAAFEPNPARKSE